MNICEIAFSTDWFLTIPGILITGGVILLIIALIMLLVGSFKGKKDNVDKEVVPQTSEPIAESFNNGIDANFSKADTDVMTKEENQTVVSENQPEEVVTLEPMGPITDSVAPVGIIPEVEIPVENSEVNTIPTVDVPPIIPSVSEHETVIPVDNPIPSMEDVVPTESIEVPNVEPVLETPDALNLEKTSVNIYGGASVTPTVPVQEEARAIYGGANPLEATQNLPKIDVHHEPYSGGKEVVEPETTNIEIPTVDSVQSKEEVATTKIVDEPIEQVSTPDTVIPEVVPQAVETTEIPVVEPAPTTPQQPSVVQIPDVEQL